MNFEIDSFFEERKGDVWRAGAHVDRKPVWFESGDSALAVCSEALGCAYLMPALLQGLSFRLSQPVCSEWQQNAQKLTQLLGDAWGCDTNLPIEAQTVERSDAKGRQRGQFFSGGVDSFYELLTAKTPPDALISLHGFDMDLSETFKFEQLKKSVQAVCAQKRIESVFLRTNIRDEPIISAVSWDDAHGGVLAAIAHLLSSRFHTVVIPPSFGQSSWRSLWGSHWKIDPLWSSKTMRIVHGDAASTRAARIRFVSTEPLVQNHLRVCWSEKAREGNCSACQKCVRTMAVLHDCGQLERFSLFDSIIPIREPIDALPYVALTVTYDELLEKGVEPKFERAIRRLIKRSHGVALRAEYSVAHNMDLMRANAELERQLRLHQETIQGMSNSRVWKAGKVFRHVRRLLK